MHARQLQCQNNDFKEVTLYLQCIRLEGKKRQNLKQEICNNKLAIEGIVLLHDTRCKKDISQKLSFKWIGPYQICNAVQNKSTYMLKELNGLQLGSTFTGNKLKKFLFN